MRTSRRSPTSHHSASCSSASSFACCTPPKAIAARRCASSTGTPARINSSASSSTCCRISASISASMSGRRKSDRRSRLRLRLVSTGTSGRGEDARHGTREQTPLFLFGAILLPSGRREAVHLHLPSFRRRPPLGVDPAAIFQSVQRRIERALVDRQHLVGELPNPLRDPPAVYRPEEQALQNEQIETALEQISSREHRGLSCLDVRQH